MAIYKNTPPIVTSGLVLHLDAANKMSYAGSGTSWNDLSGNNNTGTLTNGPTFNSNDSGGSISFDGTNDYSYIPYTSILAPTSQITFEVFINKSSWQDTSEYRIISKTESGGYQFGANSVSTYTSGYLGSLLFLAGAYRMVKYNINFLSCCWHHFCFTFDGRYFKMYVDSINVDTYDHGSQTTISYTSNNNLTIGVEASDGASNSIDATSGYLNAKISMLRIYNKGLSVSEVLQNYNAMKRRFNLD